MRYALGILLMVGLWGGLTGRNNLDAGFQKFNGPSTRVVSSEVELVNALGFFAKRAEAGQPGGSILIAGDFSVSRQVRLLVDKADRVDIAGLGKRTLTSTFSGSLFYVTAARVRVSNLRLRGTHSVDFEISGASNLALRDLEVESNYLVQTESGGDVTYGLSIMGCEGAALDIDVIRARILGNYLGTVTLGSGSGQNTVSGNHMADGDDSASLGDNAATGNVGGGSFSGWTGAGSVAGNNT